MSKGTFVCAECEKSKPDKEMCWDCSEGVCQDCCEEEKFKCSGCLKERHFDDYSCQEDDSHCIDCCQCED